MSEAPADAGRSGAPVRGIVLAHGAMAEGLVDAVRRIAGTGGDALEPMSNEGLSTEALSAAIAERVRSGPTIVFTDLPSGSCGFAARRLCRDHPGLVVISGVNLPVLLDFVLHRDLPLGKLVPRLLAKGRTGICCMPDTGEAHGHRAVSDR